MITDSKIMKSTWLILFLVALVVLVAGLTTLLIVQDVQKMDVNLEVAGFLGFNTDTDKVYFGVIPPTAKGSRTIIIANNDFKKTKVRLKLFGELKDWMTVSDNNFFLKQGESREVSLNIQVPPNAELREYETKLYVMFTRI